MLGSGEYCSTSESGRSTQSASSSHLRGGATKVRYSGRGVKKSTALADQTGSAPSQRGGAAESAGTVVAGSACAFPLSSSRKLAGMSPGGAHFLTSSAVASASAAGLSAFSSGAPTRRAFSRQGGKYSGTVGTECGL